MAGARTAARTWSGARPELRNSRSVRHVKEENIYAGVRTRLEGFSKKSSVAYTFQSARLGIDLGGDARLDTSKAEPLEASEASKPKEVVGRELGPIIDLEPTCIRSNTTRNGFMLIEETVLAEELEVGEEFEGRVLKDDASLAEAEGQSLALDHILPETADAPQ